MDSKFDHRSNYHFMFRLCSKERLPNLSHGHGRRTPNTRMTVSIINVGAYCCEAEDKDDVVCNVKNFILQRNSSRLASLAMKFIWTMTFHTPDAWSNIHLVFCEEFISALHLINRQSADRLTLATLLTINHFIKILTIMMMGLDMPCGVVVEEMW